MSSADWGSPGNSCLSRSKMVSALSSNSSLFSMLTPEPQDDFPSLRFIFLFQITIEASILFLRSRTLCSVDKSMFERNSTGLKNSTVMLLYTKSPRHDLPFCQAKNWGNQPDFVTLTHNYQYTDAEYSIMECWTVGTYESRLVGLVDFLFCFHSDFSDKKQFSRKFVTV